MDTLYKLDVVFVNENTDEKLLHNIVKDGVALMSRHTKIENYLLAVHRLEEALAECGETPSSLNRDGAMQRFEFTTELAWKACREFLLDQGFSDLNSPKSVMKQAFQFGMLTDSNAWIYILNDRNLTSHIYDEQTAQEIFSRVRSVHCKHFTALKDYLQKAV